MILGDFIKELNKYNPDADITLTTSEDIRLSFICKDLNGNDLTEATTMQVFIEGCDKQ